jgi:DNA-binding NtrC family response regulator
MKNGAFDYICKPFKIDELLLTIQRALSYELALAENEALKETFRSTKYHYEMVGDSEKMQKVYDMVEKIAKTESTVLILGESGTGKELVARAVHSLSRRSAQPFVPVNCAAIPETLLESELFGYLKGSFTGANKDKKGLFESAQGGTLFLDEIGTLPLAMQSKLLRVLQEREILPIGGTKSVPVDVRIVAATNEKLDAKVKAGQFREDLFYRLSVIPIELPPLRERAADVPLLVNHFLDALNQKEHRAITIDKGAIRALRAYHWPGNVRQLENVLMRAGALCEGNIITLNDLPVEVQNAVASGSGTVSDDVSTQFRGSSLKSFLRAKERDYISFVLQQCDGNKEKAAETLGISLATFYRKYGDTQG